MILKIFTFCIFILGLSSIANASENNFYDKGKKLFDEEKYDESKFQFEKSIVYNPKHSNSYLYLGKIFKIEKNTQEEEKNINTALLLDPKNEEAIFNLALLKIRKSNYVETQELIKTFKKICKKTCYQSTDLQKKLDNILKN